MNRILVPIDGSEQALRALRHAMAQAEEIHIVNVQRKADTPALLMHMTQHDIDRVQREHGHSMLVSARQLLDAAARPYRAHVLIGEPAPCIVDTARAEGVDAIVMGTRGMGALANMALGSTATKVVHLAELPVTLIK